MDASRFDLAHVGSEPVEPAVGGGKDPLGLGIRSEVLLATTPETLGLSNQERLDIHFQAYDPSGLSSKIAGLMARISVRVECGTELVSELWSYYCRRELWRHMDGIRDEEHMRRRLEQTFDLSGCLKMNETNSKRRSVYGQKIIKQWKLETLDQAIPLDIYPKYLSRNLLGALDKLAVKLDQAQAIAQLTAAIQDRLHTPGVGHRREPRLMVIDVTKTLEQIRSTRTPAQNGDPLPSLLESPSQATPDSITSGNPHTQAFPTPEMSPGFQDFPAALPRKPEFGAENPAVPGISDESDMDHNQAETSEEGASDKEASDEDILMAAVQPRDLVSNLPPTGHAGDGATGQAGDNAVGQELVGNEGHPDDVARLDSPDVDNRLLNPHPHPYAGQSTELPVLSPDGVLLDILGEESLKELKATGNIVHAGLFAHIICDKHVMALVEREYLVEDHHRTQAYIGGSEGFGTYFLGIQQIYRQDPLAYIIMVALRSDHNTRLVAYPNHTQIREDPETDGQVQLGFDLSASKNLQHGKGQATISLALDAEIEDYTEVATGLDHHTDEWLELLRGQRAFRGMGWIGDYPVVDSNRDQGQWGHMKPARCRLGETRLTAPSILTRQRSRGQRQHRRIATAYIAVEEDGETLEYPGLPGHSGVGRLNRDRTVPSQDASGEVPPQNRRKANPFPLSCLIMGITPVGDALLGLRSWADWEVVAEQRILLGEDRKAAADRVADIRRRLVLAYIRAMDGVAIREKAVYARNAFMHGSVGDRDGEGEGREQEDVCMTY